MWVGQAPLRDDVGSGCAPEKRRRPIPHAPTNRTTPKGAPLRRGRWGVYDECPADHVRSPPRDVLGTLLLLTSLYLSRLRPPPAVTLGPLRRGVWAPRSTQGLFLVTLHLPLVFVASLGHPFGPNWSCAIAAALAKRWESDVSGGGSEKGAPTPPPPFRPLAIVI